MGAGGATPGMGGGGRLFLLFWGDETDGEDGA
jgi:hypothetical protein